MSQEINDVFSKYKKIFVKRIDELKSFLSMYFENFVKNHILENVECIDNSERIKISGFNTVLSAWRNSTVEITLCSCENIKGIQKRYDYLFRFMGEKLDFSAKEEAEEEESKIERGFREFTEEEKELYRQQKEKEKQEVEDTLQKYLSEKTIKDVVEMIDKNQRIQESIPIQDSAESQEPQSTKKFKDTHGYSIRNYLMVLSQAKKRQDDNFIGIINSYVNWKKLGAQVLKNPDISKPYSYKILVPVIKNDALVGFKVGSVFDISQTNKNEEINKKIEEIDNKIVWKEEIEYNSAVDFAKSHFPGVNFQEELQESIIKGNYDFENKTITLYNLTAHTLFKQLGTHIVSELKIVESADANSLKHEILSELTCYLLMKKFEEAPEYKINYNFGYSNCWALNVLTEFKFGDFEKLYGTISAYVKSL